MALRCYYQKISGLFIILSLMNVNLVQSSSTTNQCLNYCSSGGVCLKSNNGPKCICLPKWTGERCDIPEKSTLGERLYSSRAGTKDARNDPCDSAPVNLCQHNGICHVEKDVASGSNVFACYCRYPYVGEYCQRVSECDDYCKNGGTCVATGPDGTVPECTCTPEWDDGNRCINPPTPTTAVPGATTTIIITTTTPPLVCTFLKPGYCNSGTCVEVNNRATCKCPPTYSGERCEIQSGASSSSGPTSGTTTGSGASSTTAPERVTCSQQPCQNGGRCYPNGNSVFCWCDPRYTGTRCQNLA